MILVTAATEMELDAFTSKCTRRTQIETCLTGIGPVEAATRVALFLASTDSLPAMVLNIGVAGAFVYSQPHPEILDLCLAEREILGDLGICNHEQVKKFSSSALHIRDDFILDKDLRSRALEILYANGEKVSTGPFVTVNCVSATRRRGDLLGRQHCAICENMEGAAVARVCETFALPMLEIRCISNLVEDRDTKKWKLQEACTRCGEIAAILVEGFVNAL
ncbi:futalosine hydrolase [Desulfogranum japonicum]|uniref:futalosine hydrolase n=1 Tax=Desulfogranum japonicum TaxID=231447 RepID=UPI00040434C4|nr:futalosine hydrolase [Desulfogranum japonicum]